MTKAAGIKAAGIRTSAIITAFTALMGAHSAQAVTADEVWALWQKQYSGEDYTVHATQDRQGDTLVLRNLELTAENDGTSFTMTVPEVRLREIGNGTVEVTFSPEAKGHTKTKGDLTDDGFASDIVLRQTDAVALLSGSADNLTYDVTAPVASAEITQVQPVKTGTDKGTDAPAQLIPGQSLTTTVTAHGIKGHHALTDSATHQNSTVTIDSVTMTGKGTGDGSSFTMDGSIAGVEMTGTNMIPTGVVPADMAKALSGGLESTTELSYGANDFTFARSAADGDMTMKATGQSGTLAMQLAKTGLQYSGANKDTRIEIAMSGAPTLSATLRAVDFDLTAPLTATEQAQPFATKVNITDLEASDSVWAMFDPSGQIPRDPAQLAFDVDGTAKPDASLLSGQMPAPTPGTPTPFPVTFETINLNNLRLQAAGVTITGTGKLAFTPGSPAPNGSVDMAMTGGMGLLDKLGNMGLIAPDQSMLAKMMIGLFARPAGDDSYTSHIEFTDAGEVLANGQKIR